jgi:hypothetical protein
VLHHAADSPIQSVPESFFFGRMERSTRCTVRNNGTSASTEIAILPIRCLTWRSTLRYAIRNHVGWYQRCGSQLAHQPSGRALSSMICWC